MDDIYSTLIGAAPAGAEQAAVVNALRRRRSFGELASLTGDKVLQPFGQNAIKGADADAAAVQDIRQKDADNAQTKAYQDWQARQAGDNLKQTLEIARMRDATDRRGQDAILEAALARANKAAGFRKMTDNTRNKLVSLGEGVRNIDSALGDFSDEYSQKLGPGPLSMLPNAAARMGVSTPGSAAASDWWSKWQNEYTAPIRNFLFGATLSSNEKADWEKMDINPTMSGDQIRSRIASLKHKLVSEATTRRKSGEVEGFDPALLDELLGGAEDIEAAAVAQQSGPTSRGGKRTTVIPTITSDEDYAALPPNSEFIDPEGKRRRKP